ncbi:hypothetical protein [Seohaeicola zhoushanensis]|uniref:Uncharacterized protein n=1 Tax=Seohaeicola zhoushanensis TaxID=1569283 RepID=A0A8J3H0E8_9RHOB|nr:hypothetical protein [Seohaeicola zhoushanensis]GHF60234.1 hypothetical protein GCM10017056_34630 [Seohaeicola zhoushanensis]
MNDYRFERQGRSLGAVALLGTIYAALILAVLYLDAAPWLMGLLALPTLPALRDVIANPSAGLHLGEDAIEWYSGRRAGSVSRDEIALLRLDRRWDTTVRAVLVLTSGKAIHLPQECLPHHSLLEAEAAARGLRVERHPFSPL